MKSDGPLSLPSYYHYSQQSEQDLAWVEQQRQPRKSSGGGGGRSRSTSGRQQPHSKRRVSSNPAIDHLIEKVTQFSQKCDSCDLVVTIYYFSVYCITVYHHFLLKFLKRFLQKLWKAQKDEIQLNIILFVSTKTYQ